MVVSNICLIGAEKVMDSLLLCEITELNNNNSPLVQGW